MTDELDKMARGIAANILCEKESPLYEMIMRGICDTKDIFEKPADVIQAAYNGILEGMKLQRERDAAIAGKAQDCVEGAEIADAIRNVP